MATIALSPAQAIGRVFTGAMKRTTRSVRGTIVISILLIFGSFVSAAVIQMRMDRTHALSQAELIETQRANEIASDLSAVLDRYAAVGTAFANAQLSPDTSAALSEAGGQALKNVAVLDSTGTLQFEMKSAPDRLLPLDDGVIAAANAGRAVIPAAGGRSLALVFASGEHLVLVELDASALLPAASMEDAVIADENGRALAIGRNWRDVPPADALRLSGGAARTDTIALPSGRRLIALAKVQGWPVIAGASMKAGEALSAWYGALPLYFFFILGPAFVGAGLAAVFVREFERRAKAAAAARKLRSNQGDDAKLLVRLAEAERRAIEAERSKSEFIMHMSHELRTPLNAIIGFSEIIEKAMFGIVGHPKYQEYARDIGDAGRRLHSKIGDVLDFSSVDAGRHPIALAETDVAMITRAAVEEAAGRAFSRKISLIAEIPENAVAIADPLALKRVLGNLLDNALRYTPEGGMVRVQLGYDGESVTIAVRDNGVGFSSVEIVKAGVPFTRFDRSGAVTGTGLGLAIASALVRRMGGTLRLAGEQGHGAQVEVRLRCAGG
ncbi:MAG TPA: ATP-binding protein [Rhizomicrobium sp.]|jgi:signal transduction histidine kinase